MNRNELERRLREIPDPEPPPGLAARLEQGIPVVRLLQDFKGRTARTSNFLDLGGKVNGLLDRDNPILSPMLDEEGRGFGIDIGHWAGKFDHRRDIADLSSKQL